MVYSLQSQHAHTAQTHTRGTFTHSEQSVFARCRRTPSAAAAAATTTTTTTTTAAHDEKNAKPGS